jgi:hypothetical protein
MSNATSFDISATTSDVTTTSLFQLHDAKILLRSSDDGGRVYNEFVIRFQMVRLYQLVMVDEC